MSKRTLEDVQGAVTGEASLSSTQHHKISRPLDDRASHKGRHTHDDKVEQQGQKIQDMIQWIQSLNGDSDDNYGSNIRIDHSRSSGWGIFSSVEIPPNSTIIRIPNAAVMTVEQSKQDSKVGKACENIFQNQPNDRPSDEFILWLDMIQGRRDKSHFHHKYLISLPSQAPDVPSWAADEENEVFRHRLLRLQGTNLGEAAEQSAKELQDQFHQWVPPLVEKNPDLFTSISLADLVWARGMYMSRRFPPSLLFHQENEQDSCTINNKTISSVDEVGKNESPSSSVGIMLPILDLLNHSPHQPITWSGSKTHVTFSTGENNSIQAGSPIYNNYGPKGNEMLMMMYGFALPNNLHDCYGLKLTMKRRLVQDVKETIEAKDLGTFQIHRIDSPIYPQFPPELWKALNEMFEEAEGDDEAEHDEEKDDTQIAIGFEAIELLRDTLRRRLVPFESTIAKDSKLEDCVSIYRDGQRRVLEQAIETLEEMMADPAVEDDEEEQEDDDDMIGF